MGLQQAGLRWENQGLEKFLRGVGRSNAVITGLSTALATTLIGGIQKAGQAMMGLVQDSVGLASTFESQVTGMMIAADEEAVNATEAFGGLGEVALSVGGDTRLLGVSATGAADSITGLLKAGIPLTDVMGDVNAYMEEGAELGGLLRSSIDMAAATELDMTQASDLAAISMSTYGMTTEETADSMDFMVRAADASVAEVGGLNAAMENIGPIANAMGFSMDEINQTLAILSTRGIRGAEAGTALKSMLTNLQRQTPKVQDAMAEYGISLYDAEGNMFDMVEILGQFEVAMKDMTEAERNAFAQTVAGTYGIKSLNTLVDEGVEGWVQMGEQIAGATGIQAQAEARTKTYASQMEALQGNIETVRIRIGKAFLPTLTNLTSWFSQMIETHGPKVTAIFQRIGERIGELASAFTSGDFEGLFEQLGLDPGWVDTIDAIVDGFKELFDTIFGSKVDSFDAKFGVGTMKETPGLIRKITDAAKNLLDTIFGTKEPMDARFQMSPGAADNTVTTFDKIIETVENVRSTIQEVWPQVKETIATVFNWIRDNGPTIMKVIKGVAIAFAAFQVVTTVVPIIMGLVNAIGVIIAVIQAGIPIFGVIVAMLGGPVTLIIGAVVALVAALGLAWTTNFLGIQDTVKDFVKDVKKFFKKFGKNFEKYFLDPLDDALDAVGDFVDDVVDFFKDLFKKLVGRSIVTDMMDEIFDVVVDTLEDVADQVVRILDAIARTVERITDAILKVWNAVFDDLKGTAEKALYIIKDETEITLNNIKKIWNDFTDKVKKIWNDFTDKIESIWDSMWNTVKGAVDSVFGDIIGNISRRMGEIVSTIKGYFNELVAAGRSIATKLGEGITAAWNTVTGAISDGISNIGTAISNAGSTILQFGRDIVSRIADGIRDLWSGETGVVGTIRNLLSNLADAASNALDAAKTVGNRIVMRVSDGIDDWWSAAGGVVSTIRGWLGSLVGDLGSAFNGIVDAGAAIVDKIKEGINNAWDGFVQWLKDKIIGIFGASEPTDPDSPFRYRKLESAGDWIGSTIVESIQEGIDSSMPSLRSQLSSALPKISSLPVSQISQGTTIDQSRHTSVTVNPTYEQVQSPASVYYDAVAALGAISAS